MKSRIERIKDAILFYETDIILNGTEHVGYEEPRESVLALEGLKLLLTIETDKTSKNTVENFSIKESLNHKYVRLRNGDIGFCRNDAIELKSGIELKLSQYSEGLNYKRSTLPFQEFGNRDRDIVEVWEVTDPSYFHYRWKDIDLKSLEYNCTRITYRQ